MRASTPARAQCLPQPVRGLGAKIDNYQGAVPRTRHSGRTLYACHFVFRCCRSSSGQEGAEGILCECPAINRKGRRARRVIGQTIWQQCAGHPFRFLRRTTTCVFNRVPEDSQETRRRPAHGHRLVLGNAEGCRRSVSSDARTSEQSYSAP
jgi:hypothetical protein